MKYTITNTHSTTRSYTNSNGQEVTFRPGETKTLKSKPPRRQPAWLIEAVEQTEKPEDIEDTSQINSEGVGDEEDDGGDN